MKFSYLCLIVLFTFIYSSISAQKLLSLEESIQLGLQNHYSIQISKKREKQALNDNTPGNAGFLPTITGTLNKSYTISGLDQEFFGGLRAPLVQSGVNSNSGNAGLAMVWTLYDGKGMFILRDRFKELQNLGAKQTETAIENLISLISSSYYDLIRQNLRVNNFRKGLEISNDRLKLAKDRYEVGQGSKVDYYSAQVDYNEDKALLIAQEQSYLNTKISYNTLLVRNHQEEFNVDSKIDLLPKLNLPELKEFALKQNPTLISALLTKKITDLDTKSIQSLQMPQIDLLLEELSELKIMKGNRVDHPRKSSKDLADAVCGAVYGAIAHTQKDLNLEIDVHTWGSAAKERNRQEFQEREERRNMQMPKDVEEFLGKFNLL